MNNKPQHRKKSLKRRIKSRLRHLDKDTKKLLLLGLVLVLFAGLFYGVHLWDSKADDADDDDSYMTDGVPTVNYNGKWYKLRDDVESLLFIGVDKDSDYPINDSEGLTNSMQCDFLGVIIIDEADKSYKLLQINRDTMTDVPVLDIDGMEAGSVYGQIALAHTYGSGDKDSCQNAVSAVKKLCYNIDIIHYFRFTTDAIAEVNDAVGGVTVTINSEFPDETGFSLGSTVTLQGKQAETFVRARMSMKDDTTNIGRMERQRDYLTALKDKLDEEADKSSSFVVNTVKDLGDCLLTDLNLGQISEIYGKLSEYEFKGFLVPEGTAQKGEEFMEFYVKDADLERIIVEEFYEAC